MSSAETRILALETSGRVGSVALAIRGGTGSATVVGVETLARPMSHAAELVPAIDRMLRAQGWAADSLGEVYVSIGPGSFTGLRIGVSIARTWAWSAGAEVVAVPTMDVLARNGLDSVPPPECVVPMLYARRAEVFAAVFELRGGAYVRIIDAHMAPPAEVLARCVKPAAILGEGVARHRAVIEQAGARIMEESYWTARAECVAEIGAERAAEGRFTPAGELLPRYIRRPDPEEKWERLHGAK